MSAGVGRAGSMPEAGVVFVGATRYTGPLAWLRLAPGWIRMVRQMRQMPGYLYHRVYYEPPFSLGTLGFFETPEDLMRFARSGEHRDLMSWVLAPQNATGGYIRIFREAGRPQFSEGFRRSAHHFPSGFAAADHPTEEGAR